MQELEGIIDGMKDSGVSMHIELLGRDFSLGDLHYINTFIEARTVGDIKAPEASCTQFSFWGSRTSGILFRFFELSLFKDPMLTEEL